MSPPAILTREIDSPLGPLLGAAVIPGDNSLEPGGVCMLEFLNPVRRAREQHELERHFGCSMMNESVFGEHPQLTQLEDELARYFDRALDVFDVALCTPGTRFQHDVWKAMRCIPLGETITYAGLAETIGHASAARAVGAASGANRVAIVIPCHRVIESGGGLRGYGGGLERKRQLLEHEGAIPAQGSLFEG